MKKKKKKVTVVTAMTVVGPARGGGKDFRKHLVGLRCEEVETCHFHHDHHRRHCHSRQRPRECLKKRQEV